MGTKKRPNGLLPEAVALERDGLSHAGHRDAAQSASRPSLDDDIRVVVYNEFAYVDNLKVVWDQFMVAVNADIWLSYDWCRLWWKFHGRNRKVHIFIFYKNGEIVSIVPLYLDTIHVWPFSLRVLKLVGTDFSVVTVGLPVKPGVRVAVIQALAKELDKRFHWDVLYLGPLSGRTAVSEQESAELAVGLKPCYAVRINETNVQTYIRVQETWDAQVSNLGKKQRENIRRALRAVEKAGWDLSVDFSNQDNFEEWFRDFTEMHARYWADQGQGGHFNDWPFSRQLHEEFAKAALDQGRLCFMRVAIDGVCVGYRYGFMFGDTYYSFLAARDLSGKGSRIDFNRVTFREQVRYAQARGLKWIDSMRGHYSHKMELGGEVMPTTKIMIWRNHPLAQFRIALFRAFAWILEVGYMKVWRRRIATRLKQAYRPLWDVYIRCHVLR